jgi:hypothetical protein
VPVARPVIFTLAGCAPGEHCVIERTENGHDTRFSHTCAANDWSRSREPWEARVGGDNLLLYDFAEAAANSRCRSDALACWNGRFAQDSFAWVTPPVLNPFTRIAIEACPAKGVLRAVGYEKIGGLLPQPVTQVRTVETVAA